MRRATVAVIGTVTGTALLIAAKAATQPAAPGTAVAGGPANGPVAAAGDVTPLPAASGSATAAPAGTPGRGGARATPTGGASTAPAGGTTAAAPKTSAVTCQSYRGAAAGIAKPGQGTATVTITVCGGVLKSASGALAGYNYQSTNDQAIPVLNSKAVRYYKTDLSAIYYSGATLTSAAYRTSLQSALAAAHL